MAFMDSLPPGERVILVAGSYGGVAMSAAMERFPGKVKVAVFVASFMPGPHLSYPAIIDEHNGRTGSFMDTLFFR
ncbi:salicylic acid-binding protein 2-like [Quillaja saponaria]|uniref:Salicylic acid-binding protein 2-like n=1 Tax=Quillaja saponaria TaxID=32244 RepID=A0AAD7P6Y5_QUISA|nr:salicylic acid-binding protein 2-like [Quillaja saponaria]